METEEHDKLNKNFVFRRNRLAPHIRSDGLEERTDTSHKRGQTQHLCERIRPSLTSGKGESH